RPTGKSQPPGRYPKSRRRKAWIERQARIPRAGVQVTSSARDLQRCSPTSPRPTLSQSRNYSYPICCTHYNQ
ncbi:unnamed protein product, partial [Hymenolepis diminuta]